MLWHVLDADRSIPFNLNVISTANRTVWTQGWDQFLGHINHLIHEQSSLGTFEKGDVVRLRSSLVKLHPQPL
jgi:hypothetical protein